MALTSPALPLPFGYPWTGHAQQLHATLLERGCCAIEIRHYPYGYRYLSWGWEAASSTGEPIYLSFDEQGYFSGGRWSHYSVRPRHAQHDRLTKREALDAMIQLISIHDRDDLERLIR